MHIISKLAAGAAALVALSGCYYYGDRYPNDRYGGDRYGPGYYDGYYDDYYGPYYGGYWGPEGYYYYYDADHRSHRDSDRHFRHEQFQGSHEVHGDRGGHDYDHDYHGHDRDGDRD